MKRRELLKGMPLAGVAVSLPSAAHAVTDDVQDWLSQADAPQRAYYYAAQLAEAMNEVRPGNWSVNVNHNLGVAMIVDHAWKKQAEGPLLADDVTGTTDYADWQRAKQRGDFNV